MHFVFTLSTVVAYLSLASQTLAIPLSASWPSDLDTAGFSNPVISQSAGGKAICVTANVPVKASATNTKFNFAMPANQSVVTETFVEFLQVGSTLVSSINAGPTTVSGTYNINAKLCVPAGSTSLSPTVLFLIHGIGFDKNYWDFAPGYSFADAAATAGYTTFSFDRLGTGASDHPDAIQVVQSALETEIAHQLIQMLRTGALAGVTYKNVVGIGHSFGAMQCQGITADYPNDLDAVVLTGFTLNGAGVPATFADWNSAIANVNQRTRFGTLSNGYLVWSEAIGNQVAFFRMPNFDASIFNSDESKKQTFTFGEIFTLTGPVKPATRFTGSVDVINGMNDFIFCQSDCNIPSDQSAAVQPALYPAANTTGSQSFQIPGVGHAINLHYAAPSAFAHTLKFVSSNGF